MNLLGNRIVNDTQNMEKKLKVVAFTLKQLEEAGKQHYPDLAFVSCTNEHGDSVLTCSRKKFAQSCLVGFNNQDGMYDFQVLLLSKDHYH